MAAILENMAAILNCIFYVDDVIEKNGTWLFWNQHLKIYKVG